MFIENPPKVRPGVSIVADFPYQVRYPKAGKNLELLHWWTQYDRGVFGLVTKKQLRRYWELVLDRHPSAEVKTLYHVSEIVQPTLALQMAHALQQYKRCWHHFQSMLSDALRRRMKRGEAMPDGVKVCTNMMLKPDYEPSEYADEEHWNCRNCERQIIIDPKVKVELFWKNGYEPIGPDEDTKDRHRQGYAKYGRIPAIVRKPHPMKRVYAAMEKFGNHSDGVGVEVPQLRWPPNDNVKFFFHGQKLKPPAWMAEMKAEIERREAEKKEQEDKRHEAERAKRQAESDAMFERYLR